MAVADADGEDPAKRRVLLIDERREALGSIGFGLVLVLAAVPIFLLSIWTTDTVLLVGTILLPAALGYGVRCLVSGVARHGVATLRLRRLHARRTGLPSARLVD